MNTTSKIFLVLSFLTFGCATAQTARPTAATVAANRGAVIVDGPSVKALGAGPGTIHAYSAYAGGTIFAAPVASGTDADCHRPAARLARLQPDRITAFDVAPGQVACLASSRQGNYELLWHASAKLAAGAAAIRVASAGE